MNEKKSEVTRPWKKSFLGHTMTQTKSRLVVSPQSVKRAKEKMKGHWWLAFWVGALSPLSYILVLSAVEMGAPLSLVAPAREMSMMVGALFGMLILGERVTAWRVTGCAILIGGVILLGSARA